MVEYLPSKQAAAGSSPVFRSIKKTNIEKKDVELSHVFVCKQSLLQLRFTVRFAFVNRQHPSFYEIRDFLNVVRVFPVFRSIKDM